MGCSSHFQNPGTPIIADNDDDGTAELWTDSCKKKSSPVSRWVLLGDD